MRPTTITTVTILALLLSDKGFSSQLAWDSFGVFPVLSEPGYNRVQAKWISELREGNLSKVASESMKTLQSQKSDFVTARIFAECVAINGSIKDYKPHIDKLKSDISKKIYADYILCAYNDIVYREEWGRTFKQASNGVTYNSQALSKIEEDRKRDWSTFNTYGYKSIEFLCILSSNSAGSLTERRNMVDTYLKINPKSRIARIIAARLYSTGQYGYSLDPHTGKPKKDRWGNISYDCETENTPNFDKSIKLCNDLLKENPKDTIPFYYLSYTFSQQHEYLSAPPDKKQALLSASLDYMKKFREGGGLPTVLSKSADIYLRTKIPAFDLRTLDFR